MSTLYAVRRRKCGCLVSSSPCRDQAAAVVGAKYAHPNGDVTVVMPLDQAARIHKFCGRGCAPKAANTQEALFG